MPVGAKVVCFGVLVLAVMVGLFVGVGVWSGLLGVGLGLPTRGGSISAGGGMATPGGRVIPDMKPAGQCGQPGSQNRKPIQFLISI